MAQMKELYPISEPHAVHRIEVAQPHELYVEECGNPNGTPVIFLHGGPGSGCSAYHRRFFDPEFYRIILFDQRGSGRSLPLGETNKNSTSDLVRDMEVIRRYLEVEKWMLFGGSWGAALALIYGQTHPGRLLGMVLRGLFLARERDLEWFFSGLGRLFPQEWERLLLGIPDGEQADLVAAYHRRIHGDDRELSLKSARAWSAWGSCVVSWNLPKGPERSDEAEDQVRLLAKARIETHYAQHRYFIKDNQILERIGSLPKVPVSIVHGRFDLTCTMESAWLLHQALPDSNLVVVPEAGHLMNEPAMVSALVQESDRMRRLFP